MVKHEDLPRIDVKVMVVSPLLTTDDAKENPSFTQVLITNDFAPACGVNIAALWCEEHQMIEGAIRCRDNDGDVTIIAMPAQSLLVIHHELGKIIRKMEARAVELGQAFHTVTSVEGAAPGWNPIDGTPPTTSSLNLSMCRSAVTPGLQEKIQQLLAEIENAGEEVRQAMSALGKVTLVPGEEDAGLLEVRRKIGLLPDRSKLN
jgi:hypothetical protein